MQTLDDILAHVRLAARDLVLKLEAIERLDTAATNEDQRYLQLAAALDGCLAALNTLNLWGPDNRLPSSELWNVAGHLLARGWLQNQARTKPRGYAGDHEMLARIYDNRCCEDPLGRLFDRYFQAQAAPQAVRNRMAMMIDWIIESVGNRENPLRVAIVGSAFGLEVRDAVRRMEHSTREKLYVTLLDLDPVAIDFAREQLSPLLPPERLTAISTNLFRLPDRPDAAACLSDTELLFCPGLFDYLDDPAAVAMLRCLFPQLAPGGRLTVFQFTPHNPTRAYMEWFGNWYLTYRDAADFSRLIATTDLPNAIGAFGAEPLGIDLFTTITRS
jgi:hypothetical protein